MGARQYARSNVSAKGFITYRGAIHSVKVMDVSVGGIQVEMKTPIPTGVEAEVVVSHKGQTVSFVGEVIRQTDVGLAMRVRPRVAGVNPLSKILNSI